MICSWSRQPELEVYFEIWIKVTRKGCPSDEIRIHFWSTHEKLSCNATLYRYNILKQTLVSSVLGARKVGVAVYEKTNLATTINTACICWRNSSQCWNVLHYLYKELLNSKLNSNSISCPYRTHFNIQWSNDVFCFFPGFRPANVHTN